MIASWWLFSLHVSTRVRDVPKEARLGDDVPHNHRGVLAAARELHTCGVKGQRRDRARVAVKGEARRGAFGVPEAHGAVGVADGVYVCVGRTGNGCHGAAVANLVPHGTLCEWLQGGVRTCSPRFTSHTKTSSSAGSTAVLPSASSTPFAALEHTSANAAVGSWRSYDRTMATDAVEGRGTKKSTAESD